MITHTETSSQRMIFRLEFLLSASWEFMTSNFSEIAFRLSTLVAGRFSPRMVLTGVSKISDMETSMSASGTDRPRSHLEMVCLTAWSLIASSSCERPLASRRVLRLSFSILQFPFFWLLYVGRGRCHKNFLLTLGLLLALNTLRRK